jgi:hypothetical protein
MASGTVPRCHRTAQIIAGAWVDLPGRSGEPEGRQDSVEHPVRGRVLRHMEHSKLALSMRLV